MSSKLKVVYLIGQLNYGGSERQLYLLLKHLDKDSFEPHVFVFNPSHDAVLNEAIEEAGVQVYQVPENHRTILQRVCYLYKAFRKLRPDIVHSWTIHDNPYAGLVGFFARIPVRIGSVRGSLKNNQFQQLPSIFQFLSLYSTQTLVVNSLAIRNELIAKHFPAGKVEYLENCVETRNHSNIPSKRILNLTRLGVPEGSRVVGMVGNLRANKNHLFFIDSLKEILDNHSDVAGIIIGQTIPDEPEYPTRIQDRISNYSLEGRIILAGFRDDVPELMHQLSVLCLPSQNEGTPNVVLEAMAAGCPVVACRVGGIPEVVHEGISGFLVAPNDLEGFTESIKTLLENPVLAEKMGQAGQKYIQKRHGCSQSTKNLERIYRQAFQKSRLLRGQS